MKDHMLKIHGIYEDFNKFLMKKGRLPMGSTRVGFWGTSIIKEVFELFQRINLSEYEHVLDLGSGDGRVVMVASLFTRASGIEFDEYLHSVARYVRGQLSKIPHTQQAKLINGNFYHYSLRDYDLLFVNPDQPLERGLEKKLIDELNGSIIVAGQHYHPKNLVEKQRFNIQGSKFVMYQRF